MSAPHEPHQVLFRGHWADARGEVPVVVENDGRTLRVEIRGVWFRGEDLDGLEPEAGTPPELLEGFVLQQGDLCAGTFSLGLPVPVVTGEGTVEAVLEATLELGHPAGNGGLDREDLRLALTLDGQQYVSGGRSGWFEDELLELQGQLPPGVRFEACFSCLYSDYSPYGHGLFGDMLCFRGRKAEYLAVRSKEDLLRLQAASDGRVQETWRCGEFEPRVPGTGYRG